MIVGEKETKIFRAFLDLKHGFLVLFKLSLG